MSNLVYVVTGGNRGIGKEICRQIAEKNRDCTILLTARDLSKAAEIVQQLGYNNIKAYQLDITSKASIDAFVATIKKEYGVIDVLINNAGIGAKGSELNEKIANDTMATNFFGVMQLNDALLPIIRNSSNGRIVNVSSSLGEFNYKYTFEKKDQSIILTKEESAQYSIELKNKLQSPTLTKEELVQLVHEFIQGIKEDNLRSKGWPANAYGVSKMALNMLTRITGRDEKNITVNCVCPGWVKTDLGGPFAERPVEKGAETPVWLAIAPLSEIKVTGTFFKDLQPANW